MVTSFRLPPQIRGRSRPRQSRGGAVHAIMSGESSSMCTPAPLRRSPKRRSTASVSSTTSRRRSTARPPTTADENASSDRSQSPRHLPNGRTRPSASSRANPNWPPPSATCGGAGLPSSAASTMAAWRSTTTRPSEPCVASRCGVHYAPLLQGSVNIGSWFPGATRHGRPVRTIAATTRSSCKSLARI